MAYPMEPKRRNNHENREPWLRQGIEELRPHFKKHGYNLPELIRSHFGFTSFGKRGKVTGECIYPDGTNKYHEIIVRCDKDDPVEVINVFAHQLAHAVTGPKHDKAFRDCVLRLGFDITEGLEECLPGPVMHELIETIARNLGPLPHDKIDLETVRAEGKVADGTKKQEGRQRKAECLADHNGSTCGYFVHITRERAREFGPPPCPIHLIPLTVIWKKGDQQPEPEKPVAELRLIEAPKEAAE